MGRLVVIRSGLEKARDLGEIRNDLGVGKLEFSSNSLELLQSFDDEVSSRQQEAKAVGRLLAVVWRESAERARDEAGHAHEHALVVACRLWEASAVESMAQRARVIDRVRQELSKAEEVKKNSAPSLSSTEEDSPVGVDVERLQKSSSSSVAGAQLNANRGAGQVVQDTGRNNQQSSVAQVDEIARVQSGAQVADNSGPVVEATSRSAPPNYTQFNAGAQVKDDSEPVVKATPRSATLDVTPVTAGTKIAQIAEDIETNPDVTQSSSSVAVLDATVVSDSAGRGDSELRGGESSIGSITGDLASKDSGATISIEVVVGESSSYVDVEGEVEDDVSDPTKVGLKVLDVTALLIEKVLFVGLPTLVSGGSLVWERVDNAMNGAKGRKGWRLLKRLRKDSIEVDDA